MEKNTKKIKKTLDKKTKKDDNISMENKKQGEKNMKNLNEKEQEIVRLLYIGNKKAKQVRDAYREVNYESGCSDVEEEFLNKIVQKAQEMQKEYYEIKNETIKHFCENGKAKCNKYHNFPTGYFNTEKEDYDTMTMYCYEIGDFSFHATDYFFNDGEDKVEDGGDLDMIASDIKGEVNVDITFDELLRVLAEYIDYDYTPISLTSEVEEETEGALRKFKEIKDVDDIRKFVEEIKGNVKIWHADDYNEYMEQLNSDCGLDFEEEEQAKKTYYIDNEYYI